MTKTKSTTKDKSIGAVSNKFPERIARYSDEELKEFDVLLDVKIVNANEQIEFFKDQLATLSHDDSNKVKSLEDGSSAQEMAMVSELLKRQELLLVHLINAKHRIKNRTYGVCIETGKLIQKERLRAVPHTTKTVEAKQM
jgi:DnaK suppressor protein